MWQCGDILSISNHAKECFDTERRKKMKPMIYGYARVSTAKQKLERQIDNIKSAYPDVTIITDKYTGRKMNRPNWTKLYKSLREGDTVVFDEVSRMSRNAEEGFAVYRELYDKGVNLVFLKESPLNTDCFRKTDQIPLQGDDVDLILKGVNAYLMKVAENQIKAAFATAQHEVELLSKRTSEGVRRAIADGKQVGWSDGSKITTKKSIEAKKTIREHAKAFGGSLTDGEVMKLTGLARNTYYKYKREIAEEG